MDMPVRIFPAQTLPNGAHADEKLFVMTDLHGSIHAMRRLLAHKPDDARLVFLGDSTDRGPSSVDVLETLDSFPDAVLLRGNHDLMAWFAICGDPSLDKRDMAELRELWLFHNGGSTTVSDFIVHEEKGLQKTSLTPHDLYEYVKKGKPHILFKKIFDKSLRYWKSGNLFFVHGGLAAGCEDIWLEKPDSDSVSMSWEAENHWSWYRPSHHRDGWYEKKQRIVHGEPVYIVNGHTPQDFDMLIYNYGMFLDTGYTLKTAAIIDRDQVQLIMTPCDEVMPCQPEIMDIFAECEDK